MDLSLFPLFPLGLASPLGSLVSSLNMNSRGELAMPWKIGQFFLEIKHLGNSQLEIFDFPKAEEMSRVKMPLTKAALGAKLCLNRSSR